MQPGEFLARVEARNKGTVFEALGITVLGADSDSVTVGVTIEKKHFQHAGIVHGGIYVLLAESAASMSAAMQVDLEQFDVFGMEINANHLRAKNEGSLRAKAKPIFKGSTTMVYGIEIEDENQKLVSVSRCTLAIRPKRK